MPSNRSIIRNIDWVTAILYSVLVVLGWINIYAAIYNAEAPPDPLSFSNNAGRQLIWVGTALILALAVLIIDHKFYETFAYIIYGIVILALVAVLFLGTDIKGSHSWIRFGPISIQPAEFAKLGTSLALARYLGDPTITLGSSLRNYRMIILIIGVPAILILLSNETGSMLVLTGLLLMLYREGLPGVVLILVLAVSGLLVVTLLVNKWMVIVGIIILTILTLFLMPPYQRRRGGLATTVLLGVVFSFVVLSVDYFVNDVLQPHQRRRVMVLVNPDSDPQGAGWNVIQSKIAIGSGGVLGKGFLEGTQTKLDFVPEQSTDFIFCTVGEEHGFLGSLAVVVLFLLLICRIIFLAERQRSRFTRVFGFSIAGVFFFHVMVNIGMTIGLMPVIGIPLPYFSYGGSSLWSFTILLFVFLKIEAQRPYNL